MTFRSHFHSLFPDSMCNVGALPIIIVLSEASKFLHFIQRCPCNLLIYCPRDSTDFHTLCQQAMQGIHAAWNWESSCFSRCHLLVQYTIWEFGEENIVWSYWIIWSKCIAYVSWGNGHVLPDCELSHLFVKCRSFLLFQVCPGGILSLEPWSDIIWGRWLTLQPWSKLWYTLSSRSHHWI